MKQLRYYLMPIWQAFVELLFYTPIWLTYVIYFVPMDYAANYIVLSMISYWVVYLICKSKQQITNRYRLLWSVILGVIPIILLHSLANLSLAALAVGAVLGVFFVNQSFLAVSRTWAVSFHSGVMIAFILIAIALQVIKVISLHALSQYNMLYFGAGISALIIMLYIHNERMITNQQMIDRQSVTIKRSIVMNRWYISILSVLTIAISLFREFQEKIEQWIKSVLTTIIGWMQGDEQAEVAPIEQPSQSVMPFEGIGEESEPSLFWILLEKIVTWLIYIIIVVAAIFLIYLLIRKVIPLAYRYLLKLLGFKHAIQHDSESYTDEIEVIVPQRTRRSFKLLNNRRFDPLKHWERKTSAEKIRALYQYVITFGKQAGVTIKAEYTAKENLTELMKVNGNTNIYTKLLNNYDEVKYGLVEKDSKTADQLKIEIEQNIKR